MKKREKKKKKRRSGKWKMGGEKNRNNLKNIGNKKIINLLKSL
jgi:hypothetical protein